MQLCYGSLVETLGNHLKDCWRIVPIRKNGNQSSGQGILLRCAEVYKTVMHMCEVWGYCRWTNLTGDVGAYGMSAQKVLCYLAVLDGSECTEPTFINLFVHMQLHVHHKICLIGKCGWTFGTGL